LNLRVQEIVGARNYRALDEAATMRASVVWGKQAPRIADAPSSVAGTSPPVAGTPSHAIESASPILILTIANGAGHTRTAQAVAEAIKIESHAPSCVVDVADHMDALTRFTHVTAYLWLVKHAPAIWGRVDRYQKRQTQTSPEWYYRRGCRSLFRLARRVRPRALVATEVGCCEIAALIKRDLSLDAPLVAVNAEYDADRAWVQPEVDLYTVMTEESGAQLRENGAQPERIGVWGAPLSADFGTPRGFEDSRAQVCRALSLDENQPLVLMSGGGEGLGQIEATLARLLAHGSDDAPQIVVLTGRNARLKARCEQLAAHAHSGQRVRVLGWIDHTLMARLMRASDVLVSKCGNTFDEAIASELPLVALEPPPGSERVQYDLLEKWGTGRAAHTIDELSQTVRALLADEDERARIRARCRARRRTDAAQKIARWLAARDSLTAVPDDSTAGHSGSVARCDEVVSHG
jgi:processive 1,2-diacylglycerol beta-glucosyltransferase